MNILSTILSALVGGSGAASAITNGVKWTAIAATLPLFYQWYQGHAGDQIVCLNVAQSLLLAVVLFAVVQVAHRANPQ